MSSYKLSHTSPFASNPIETREDLSQFLIGLLGPLAAHTSPGGARVYLGHTATHYDDVAAQLEGFSRPIWGLASLLAGGGTYEGVHRWVEGLANGTDPDNVDEFWGEMRDKDQRMVECSAIGFAIAVAGKDLWDPLSERAKRNLENWLGGMNDKEMPNTNWLWFRVFANLGLSKVSSPKFDAARMKADLDHLDTFYIGNGWSRDGPEGILQLDYYSSSFAIQFAQLVYSRLAQDEDPERCEEFRSRGSAFALDFVHYFDPEGRAIPFGRSLTYRFAMSSFWGAFAFAFTNPSHPHFLPPPFTWGIIKGLQLRNIRYWAHQPGAFSPSGDGTLSIGFNYPNGFMTENYNSPGSVYWCCKSFIALALPVDHPFWVATEEPYPGAGVLQSVKVLPEPLHITVHAHSPTQHAHSLTHTYLLSSGQQCSYPVKASAAKYGKYAYSSAFGFSVPTGGMTLEEVAGDSVLALSEDAVGNENRLWRCRSDTREARVEGEAGGEWKWLRSMWYPWSDVEVETWLVPPPPPPYNGGQEESQSQSEESQRQSSLWHLRIHRIKTGRKLKAAEGGWAIYGQGVDGRALARLPSLTPNLGEGDFGYGYTESGRESLAVSKAGVSGIVDLTPNPSPSPHPNADPQRERAREAKVIRTDPNSNLVSARAVLPTLMGDYDPRERDYWVVTGVYGGAAPLAAGGGAGSTPGPASVPGSTGVKGWGWLEDWAEERRPWIPKEIAVLMNASGA